MSDVPEPNLSEVILYNRKKHRYEYYRHDQLRAYSAYEERLRRLYPTALVQHKHPIPNSDEDVLNADTLEW